MSLELYHEMSKKLSIQLTNKYSTSFSLGIKMIDKECRWAIYAIYGLVRLADEIVDTFYGQNQAQMLKDFKAQTYLAIENKLSINPILHAFQLAANQYNIPNALIESFFKSMEMDLDKKGYDEADYNEYIYGSAEVVGLMCLQVFCNNDREQYDNLKGAARALGAAFQKVNFLRDMKDDFEERGRTYFPGVNFNHFTNEDKKQIVQEIKDDFATAYNGILQLPINCRFGVYTAYKYYLRLLECIEKQPAEKIKNARIRVPDSEKIGLLLKSYLIFKTGNLKHA